MKQLDDYPALARRGVWTFALANGDIVLYAPQLGGQPFRQVSATEAERLDEVVADEAVWSVIEHKRKAYSRGTMDLRAMAIMPSAHCNLHCAYCYASEAHGRATLSERQIREAVGYFFARWGGTGKDVSVSILGGGEPLTAPVTTRTAMRIVREAERDSDSRVRLTLVTNGSLMNDELADELVRWNVTPRVSFDVLPELQHQQRGKWNEVLRGLNCLFKAEVHPEIRTVVTALSVGHLSEIVERVSTDYPMVQVVRADPVVGAIPRSALTVAEEFPDRFAEARRLARRLGITLDCMPWRLPFFDGATAFCPGEFGVSPDGTLTICHRKSGRNECSSAGWGFGEVAPDGQVRIDEERLASLMKPVDVPAVCHSCVLGGVCRGGCRATRALNDLPIVRQARCRMLRRCFDLAVEEWLEWKRDTGESA